MRRKQIEKMADFLKFSARQAEYSSFSFCWKKKAM